MSSLKSSYAGPFKQTYAHIGKRPTSSQKNWPEEIVFVKEPPTPAPSCPQGDTCSSLRLKAATSAIRAHHMVLSQRLHRTCARKLATHFVLEGPVASSTATRKGTPSKMVALSAVMTIYRAGEKSKHNSTCSIHRVSRASQCVMKHLSHLVTSHRLLPGSKASDVPASGKTSSSPKCSEVFSSGQQPENNGSVGGVDQF